MLERAMLRRQYRFHGHGGLKYLYKNGRTARSRSLSLRYVENKRRPHSRVTVVVSKKVSKSAVVRNRIRRRVYETVRLHWRAITPNHDMVFTVHSAEIATLPALDVQDMVLDVLHRARLYRTEAISGILENSL